MATAASCSPSEILGIDRKEEPWVAFCVDRAVLAFGQALSNELESVEGKSSKEIQGKRQRILNRWFPGQQKFADPGKR